MTRRKVLACLPLSLAVMGALCFSRLRSITRNGRTDTLPATCVSSKLREREPLQWDVLTLPGDGSFKKICFVDSDTGWAVGENGTILHTVDGGQSWIKQVSGTSLVLFDVQFFDKSVGYIIGGDNQDEDGGFRGHFTSILLRTDDGGENWNSVNIPTRNLHWSLSFADRQTGWLLGWDPSAFNQTVVYHTTDGGATWEQNPVAIDPEGTGMFDISMLSIVDKSNIWGIGEQLVRHSTDGGATWDIAYRKTRNAYSAFNDSVQFIDSSTGWACERIDCGGDAIIEPDVSDCEMGNYTFMLRTTDGGSTWQRNRAPRGDVFISFRFLDRCVGIAAGRYYSGPLQSRRIDPGTGMR